MENLNPVEYGRLLAKVEGLEATVTDGLYTTSTINGGTF